ncbi:uncharacterized protein LODBEIA_P28820 [Lodderomyces beijingensis]|uniref:Octanoyltransferase n=1 Tax=Lodderomyces beijingensis TaxID=1775926 RepID=A0ABP0ZLZ2_9ASCO
MSFKNIRRQAYHTIRDSYRKKLQHIDFPGISSFQHGLDIQQAIMSQNLNFKSFESALAKQLDPSSSEITSHLYQCQPPPTLLTFQFQHTYAGGLKSKKQLTQTQIKAFTQLLLPATSHNVALPRQAQAPPKFYQLERGGQVTYHGPGQLVAYLILDLREFVKLTPKCFVNNVLLKSLQNVLRDNFEIASHLSSDNPGVWIKNREGEDEKLASVGVRIRRGVTEFGVAVNVDPQLDYLNTFEMCGLKNRATSIREILEKRSRSGDESVCKLQSVETCAGFYAAEIGRVLELDTVEKIVL